MNFDTRDKIVNFLRQQEVAGYVEGWKIKDVDVWPAVKLTIFFTVIKEDGDKKVKKFSDRLVKKIARTVLEHRLVSKLNYRRISLSAQDVLFVDSPESRVTWKGQSFNRYFDQMLDFIEEAQLGKGILLERDAGQINNAYKSQRRQGLDQLYRYFKVRKRDADEKLIGSFIEQHVSEVLLEVEKAFGVSATFLRTRVANSLSILLFSISMWEYILGKIRPRYILQVVYYNPQFFALNYVARKLNIPTFDMQHGGVGVLHIAYNYHRLPVGGYNTLPKTFWAWNQGSYHLFQKFVGTSEGHSVVLGNNPWIEYLANVDDAHGFGREGKAIVLALQTTMFPVLDDFIIQAIKNTEAEYFWVLRLHPRMSKAEVNELETVLKAENLSDKVVIQRSADMPLPILLVNCFAHLSKASGTIEEANELGVAINIVIHKLGEKNYRQLIESGDVLYYDDTQADQIGLYDFIKANAGSYRPIDKSGSKQKYERILTDMLRSTNTERIPNSV